MITSVKQYLRNVRGVAAVEAALIMPVLFIMYFGMIDLTGSISTSRRVTYAASVMADLVTQHRTSLTAAEVTEYYAAVNLVMSPIQSTNVRTEVYGFRKVGTTVTKIWSKKTAGGPSCGTEPGTGAMNALMSDANDLIVARVCTTYTPWVATFMGKSILGASSFTVGETITQRPRSSAKLDCYTTATSTTSCT